MRKALLFFITVCILVIIYNLANVAYACKIKDADNNPPQVKITNPKNNSFFTWDAPFGYEITVADKEDGNSKYDEINAKEVLLEVKYVVDEKALQAELAKGNLPEAAGLALIRTSNCFNCHNFNSKLIGPSFNDICKRYAAKADNVGLLAKRIREGTTGVWGKVTMPTHPEFTSQQAQDIVQWIFDNAAKPNVNYYIGTEGAIRIKQPADFKPNAAFLLTASYVDHGLKDMPNSSRLKGQDMVVVKGK
jgi:cytochrome c